MQPLLKHRYQVLQVLSEAGGFGQTFLAEDIDTPSRRQCVIKKLKPIANPDDFKFVQERFQREAAVLEKLGEFSDQIPKLYAYFVENQELFLVQELIDGLTLRQKVKQEGTLSEDAVKESLVSLLNVLAYVHEQKIIHRDINPNNIILRQRDNKPVLIDFGIVKEVLRVDADGNPTSTVKAGTPGYMSLEQAMGRPVFASDLYSLGATAIFLLTGKNPQQITNLATGAINWRQHVPKVSSDFAAVLDKATELYTRDRYQTAYEMREELDECWRRLSYLVATPTPESSPDFNTKQGKTEEPSIITIVRPGSLSAKINDNRDLLPFRKGDKFGFSYISDNLVIETKYDDAGSFHDGLAAVKLKGKWGFIDETGKEVIHLMYDAAKDFRGGLAAVNLKGKWGRKGKWGFVDTTGKEVTPLKYDDADSHTGGLAQVRLNSKWWPLWDKCGFIDKTGKEVIPLKYDYAGSFSYYEGLAEVGLNGKYGFIDETGKEVVPLKYDTVEGFHDGLAKVKRNGKWGSEDKWGFIDKTGKEVIPLKYDNEPSSFFSEGLVAVKRNGKWGFVDWRGKEVIPLKYRNEPFFTEGLAMVKVNGKWGFLGKGKWGFIDKSGKEVIAFKYDAVDWFHRGLARVKLNGKWGLIDKTGKEVIPLKYGNQPFFEKGEEGLAAVKLNGKWGFLGKGKWGFVDKSGKEVIPLKYDYAGSFTEGLAQVALKGKWGFVDKSRKEVISLKYDDALCFSDGLAAVKLKGKWGFVDETGKEVIPLKYDVAFYFSKGLAKVKLKGREFYIDKNGT